MSDSLKQNIIKQERYFVDHEVFVSETSSRSRTIGQPTDCWNCRGIGKITKQQKVCNICFGGGKLYV